MAFLGTRDGFQRRCSEVVGCRWEEEVEVLFWVGFWEDLGSSQFQFSTFQVNHLSKSYRSC